MWRSSRSATGSEAGALLLLALATACAERPAGAARAATLPRNVILICWDTVRADHLGCYGYERHETTPTLDALAARSLFFADASAVAGWTKPSVPSFLTGTYPSQHGVYEGSAKLALGEVTDTLPEASLTLAEVLQGAGYQTAAFVRNAQLRPGNGFEQGFDLYRDEAGDARAIRWQALDWLDDRDAERPFFLYLHFLDAHAPYPVPDEYASRFTDADVERFRGRGWRAYRDAVHDGEVPWTDDDRAAIEGLYDGALRYLDDQLARLLSGLEARGLTDSTVVSVLSDHGEEFGERGRLGHGHGLWETLLRVPWVLHVPGRSAERVDSPASLVDLFPTLLTAVGAAVPMGHAGTNWLGPAPRSARPILAEHKGADHYLQSLRRDATKLVRTFRPPPETGDAAAFALRLGDRWRARFALSPDGAWSLAELEEDDDDSDDPVELKAPLQEVHAEHVVLAGVSVKLTATTRHAPTDDAGDGELYPGRMVKVRLDAREGGLAAERIKIYRDGTPEEYEVRGPLTASSGARDAGSVRVGPFDLDVGAASVIPPGAEGGEPRMERDQVVRALTLGGGAARSGFDVARSRWSVAGWTEREVTSGGDPSDESFLDELTRDLVETRVFDDGDRVLLTPDAVERLRAIGYVQ